MSWEYLRGHKLAITVFEGCDHFLDASCEAWRVFADDPNRIAVNHTTQLGNGQ